VIAVAQEIVVLQLEILPIDQSIRVIEPTLDSTMQALSQSQVDLPEIAESIVGLDQWFEKEQRSMSWMEALEAT